METGDDFNSANKGDQSSDKGELIRVWLLKTIMNTPLIRNYQYMPPIGGWSVSYVVKGKVYMADGFWSHVVDRILTHRQKNGEPNLARSQVLCYCNKIWMARDPKRAMVKTLNCDSGESGEAPEKYIHPHLWGAAEWAKLHSFGRSSKFTKSKFLDQVRSTLEKLNPVQTPSRGCYECLDHFGRYITDNPLSDVQSHADAAKWSFNAHDAVRKRQGKSRMSFEEAAEFHGWDL